MATDPFVHLRVASGYSLMYGANQPADLVTAAAEYGMDALALTDRDGVSGAVRFVQACTTAGIDPIVGVDLAVLPLDGLPTSSRGRRTPARGGAERDPRLPRMTVLARPDGGWAALCRLISAVHAAGQRNIPIATTDLICDHASGGDLVVLAGADAEIGRAVARKDRSAAVRWLTEWRRRLPQDSFVIGVEHHLRAGHGPGSGAFAARLQSLAEAEGIPSVLSNAVRMTTPDRAPVVDILDASRRLVPLAGHNVDRSTAECWLKPGVAMHLVADDLARRGGGDAGALLARTRALADRCRLDAAADLGIGIVHLPELGAGRATGDAGGADAAESLAQRCRAGISRRWADPPPGVSERLADELAVVARHGFETYFLTVADIVDSIRARGVRCAARGSGAGSLINYLLGVSGVDPIEHDLVFERFLSPLRHELPDIDLDVESARRPEIYDMIIDDYGTDRVACVAMVETYRVRHAVRDVGAALSLPPAEVDAIAKAFPHLRASRARSALAELPELRAAGLADGRLDLFFRLVEGLDGLPRHLALHPCGIVLSDRTLLDRTPVQTSHQDYPLSQFDKDDVEAMGLLKLDVLGIRMQSAMAHAVAEIERTCGERVELDALRHDDEATFELVRSTETLGCFQIESPGQRELIGKFAPETFGDLIIDISLFRPGPVKSDMVRPFLEARQGWTEAQYLHPDLREVLDETYGVVVFHEQVMRIIAIFAGCSVATGDAARRKLGTPEGQEQVRTWFISRARQRDYSEEVIARVWQVLAAFGSFGFCKAHAAAFALPTYQSAWLKAHYPAHFLAGVLTHDPGMYPKRLLLEEARRHGVRVLGPDVNASDDHYRAERLPDGGWGLRIGLADLLGIDSEELARIIAGRPFESLTDFWRRARPDQPTAERLVVAGAFDEMYGINIARVPGRRNRRDLMLAVADLHRAERAHRKAGHGPGQPALELLGAAVTDPMGFPTDVPLSGLPEMSDTDRVRAELDVLGLDISRHVVDFHRPMLDAIGVTRAADLLRQRNQSEVLVAGVKVATQTPPVRSGQRVVFLTLDDASGPADAAFFANAADWVGTVFAGWLLVVRGVVRRSGPRGISLRATGCWDMAALDAVWRENLRTGSEAEAAAAVRAVLDAPAPGSGEEPGVNRVLVHASGFTQSAYADVRTAGSVEPRRNLWHASPGSSGPTAGSATRTTAGGWG
ncbi:DNA polymerase III subunit alpha [Enemella sp. A6]|uniref:DNA polymerase III subunit alpha n=1 Tax=Enemella sp. A6 TaxID=3440152 RepID=UPI003EB7F3E7